MTALFVAFFLMIVGCDNGVGIGNDNNDNANNVNNQNNNNPNPDLVILYTESYPDSTEINVFTDEWIASVELENTASEPVVIEQLLFYISEPTPSEVKNAKLYIGDAVVATLDNNQTAGFPFRPEGGVEIEPGAKALFQFRAELTGGLCKEANTLYQPMVSENRARGLNSGEWFTFSHSGEPVIGNATRMIVGNGLLVTTGPDNPPDGEVMQYSQDVMFFELSLFPGENMTINSLRYFIDVGCSLCLDDFKVWTKNAMDEWYVVAGPEDPQNWSCQGADCSVTLEDQFNINKCEEFRITSSMDVGQMPIGASIWVTIDASGVEAVSTDTQEPVPQEHIIFDGDPDIWGNTQIVIPYQNP